MLLGKLKPGDIPAEVRDASIRKMVEVPTAALFQKNAVISGITVGSRAQQLDMVAAIDANGITPVIDRSFELAAIADAFRLQESQQHFGKICLSI